MKIPDSIKKPSKFIIDCLLMFIVANQLSHPAVLSVATTRFAKGKTSEKIQIVSKDLYIDQFLFLDPSLDSRNYLNLSSSIVHKYAKDEHVCRHFANSTYDVYQNLIKNNYRTDLSDKVRMAATTDHQWLEILENEKWVPYESTYPTPPLSKDDIEVYSDKSKLVKSFINTENSAEVVTIPGNKTFIPRLSSFLEPGGLAGGVYRQYRKHVKRLVESSNN